MIRGRGTALRLPARATRYARMRPHKPKRYVFVIELRQYPLKKWGICRTHAFIALVEPHDDVTVVAVKR